MPRESGRKIIAQNRKARHDYHIEDTFEAGLVLQGTEVKSLRAGRASLVDGFAEFDRGELWLVNVHIPIYKTRRLHAGTDFAVPCGTPIKAAASGTVYSRGWGGGYGNRIVVNHGRILGKNVVTTYNHMSRYAANKGDFLSRGEVLGYVGTTGASTGCHLHFEVLVNGSTVNPMGWL